MLNSVFNIKRGGVYIAEIGLNHNGSIETAKKMIDAAREAGADAVKFQTFVPEFMNSVYTRSLLQKGFEETKDTSSIDFFRKFVLSGPALHELKEYCEKIGVLFFSSPFDPESVDFLEKIGVRLYKIASSEVTNHSLIKKIARTGKPSIMSTGISTEEEIASAVEIFRKESRADLVLLHCVSLYPLDPENANLERIRSLRSKFSIEVGFSDHTTGIQAPVTAAALGARLFEKHFKIDKNHDCPDKEVSLTPREFSALIDAVEKTIVMLGDGRISYGNAEAETARAARRSLFARRFIPAGKVLEWNDIIALRPGTGLPEYAGGSLVGKKSRVAIEKDFLLKTEFFE